MLLRRFSIIAIVVVSLGALTTFVVSWGCALTVNNWYGTQRVVVEADHGGARWQYRLTRCAGAMRVTLQLVGGMPDLTQLPDTPPAAVPSWHTGWPATPMLATPWRVDAPAPAIQDARGWPWLAMSSLHRPYYLPGDRGMAVIRGGIFAGSHASPFPINVRILPLAIIWPGFLANSAVYAALWTALLLLPGTVRAAVRAHRRAQGCCPRCRYPAGASSVCSECGEALSPPIS